MSDPMFLVLLVALGLLPSWLISKMDEMKKSIEASRDRTLNRQS
jgi:hypothetical protein